MKYLKPTWVRITLVALPLLIIIAIFLHSSNHNEIPQSNISQPDITMLDGSGVSYDNFKVENISIARRKDNRLFFSFSADKVIHRKRISKFFVYHNLKEIELSGIKIDFYPYKKASLKNKNILIPLDDIGSSFASLGKPSTPMEDYLAGDSDIDLDLLSRILFQNMSLNIFLAPQKKFSITAKLGLINTDFENIVLEGPVTVTDSDNKKLLAARSVWSNKFNGLYLPDGYTLENKGHKGKTFFAITKNGKFLKIRKCPNIVYTDFVEEREKVLYAYLSKKMPAHLRLMFGLQDKY